MTLRSALPWWFSAVKLLGWTSCISHLHRKPLQEMINDQTIKRSPVGSPGFTDQPTSSALVNASRLAKLLLFFCNNCTLCSELIHQIKELQPCFTCVWRSRGRSKVEGCIREQHPKKRERTDSYLQTDSNLLLVNRKTTVQTKWDLVLKKAVWSLFLMIVSFCMGALFLFK